MGRGRTAAVFIAALGVVILFTLYYLRSSGNLRRVRIIPKHARFKHPKETVTPKVVAPKTTKPVPQTAPTEPSLIHPTARDPTDLQQYNGITVLPYKPPPYSQIWSVAKLEDYYYTITTTNHAVCANNKRIGRNGDGGWDVCLAGPYKPQAPCYSYSFGVGNIWEFDEQTASVFGCKVRTFDPTMGRADHQHSNGVLFFNLGIYGYDGRLNNWSVLKYSSMLKRFKEDSLIIDIVKMDVEYAEWSSLEAMLSDGSLKNVKQVLMETHTSEVQGRTTSKADLLKFIRIQQKLEQIGFRRWKHHWNPAGNYRSAHTSKSRTCCYEHYYININFLKKDAKVRNSPAPAGVTTPATRPKNLFQSLTYQELKLNSAWSNQEAEEKYHIMMQTDHARCPVKRRIGRAGDGGWDICLTDDTKPGQPCLVYSFGVNNVWEFDDQLASEFKCEVFAFDPSMSSPSHKRRERLMFYREGLSGRNAIQPGSNWKLNTLGNLVKRFNHQDKIIDIIKIDIEKYEWESFEAALTEGALTKVRQLVFETHTDEVFNGPATTSKNYLRYMGIWQKIYNLGFRQWQHHWNHFGNYRSRNTGKQRTCCHEHYLVNINLLKKVP